MTILEGNGWAEGYGGIVVAIVAAVALLGFLVSGGTQKKQRLPPGPRGWPVLGCLPLLGPLPHKSLYDLSKQYGPIMFIRLGAVRTVVVSSPQLAEEILKTHDQIMSSRPVLIAAQKLFYGGLDIGFAPYGHYWRYVKKVSTVGLLTSLRISQSREIREREVLAALRFIVEESNRGNPVNIAECFSTISMNNITQITMNKSYCVQRSGSEKGADPAKGILAAAGDSSSIWAEWVMTELIRHPHVMNRVQAELDSVVGPHRLVQEDDLPNLKYLHAVVKEAFRLHPIGPMLLPHQSTEDCKIQGFDIPARTRVMVNVWAIQRDPLVWERPLEFDPDRFLNSTDIKGQNFEYLPFGSGRRMCPGYNLGWIIVIYTLAMLLHALDCSLPEGQKPEEMDMSEVFGVTLYKKVPLAFYGKARLPNHVIYPAQPEEK